MREALKQLNVTSPVAPKSPVLSNLQQRDIEEEKEVIPELLVDIEGKENEEVLPEIPVSPSDKSTDDNDVVAEEEPHNVKAPAHVDTEAAMKEAEEKAEEVAKEVEEEKAIEESLREEENQDMKEIQNEVDASHTQEEVVVKEKNHEDEVEKGDSSLKEEAPEPREEEAKVDMKNVEVVDEKGAHAPSDAKPLRMKPIQRVKLPEISPGNASSRKHELMRNADVLVHNSLWLSAEDGVTTSASKGVSYWADVSSGGRGSSGVQGFTPMPKDVLRQANR